MWKIIRNLFKKKEIPAPKEEKLKNQTEIIAELGILSARLDTLETSWLKFIQKQSPRLRHDQIPKYDKPILTETDNYIIFTDHSFIPKQKG